MSPHNKALSRALDETLVACLLLTELGFSPDEIRCDTRNVANADPPGPWATVTVSREDKEFVIAIAALLDDEACAGYPAAWHAVCQQPIPKRVALRIVRRSRFDTTKLLAGLTEAGFQLTLGGPP